MSVAIYAGSFNPFTNGHLNILTKAASIFDTVILAIGHNPKKESDFFTVDERITAINRMFDMDADFQPRGDVVLMEYSGLLADFAAAKGVRHLIRGLRPLGDFDYEYNMAMTNRLIRTDKPPLETVFLLPDAEVMHMSSTVVRELLKHKADITAYVPKGVKSMIGEKFGY